jgi:hypothetical protein
VTLMNSRLRTAVAAAGIAVAAAGCSGSSTGPTPNNPGLTAHPRGAQGVALDAESPIEEIDYQSRVGLIDNSVIPYSSLTRAATSPVKILSVQAMSPSPGLRVLAFIAYRYSQTPGSSGSRGPIHAPYRPLVGLSVTHAFTYWWQVRLQPEQTGKLSVHGIEVTYEEAGKVYHQLLPVTYVMHVHAADFRRVVSSTSGNSDVSR